MSVLIASNYHISVVANYISRKGGATICESLEYDPQKIGELLYKVNVDSYNCRYQEDDNGPGFVFDPKATRDNISPVEMLKAVLFLTYQCNESPYWGICETKKILKKAEYDAIGDIPGYKDAPWGLTA